MGTGTSTGTGNPNTDLILQVIQLGFTALGVFNNLWLSYLPGILEMIFKSILGYFGIATT